MAKKKPTFDRNELAAASRVHVAGTPQIENGPLAWTLEHPWMDGQAVSQTDILGAAACQLTPRGKRPVVDGRFKVVVVIADEALHPGTFEAMAERYAIMAGSYTEALRAAPVVRWLPLGRGTMSPAEIGRIAHGECLAAADDITNLLTSDVMFLVWKGAPDSFSGRSVKEVAEAIVVEAFTRADVEMVKLDRAPARDDPDDDAPADFWKRLG